MMTIPERAAFVLAIITNEKLQISAGIAAPLVECQDWLRSMTPEVVEFLKEVSDGAAKKV
jgi:hypothetical protein